MKVALIILAMLAALAIGGMLIFVFVVQNVETPDYQVVEQDEPFEIRDYPAMVVAEVKRGGSRQEGLSAGFGPLARYIFAKERGGAKIAMTAPVEQQPTALQPDQPIAMTVPVTQSRSDGGAWSVRFIMPSAYRIEDLPAPAGEEVRLREIPARRVAAVRFSGRTNDALIAAQEEKLRDWLAQRGVEPTSPAVYAYYNDPFTPGLLRRNEVMLEIPN